jgi:hypothetical protein
MTTQEISHLIATAVRGWTQQEGVVYTDAEGNTQYITNYCDSVPHALDLAQEQNIALLPVDGQWKAFKLANGEAIEAVMDTETVDSNAGKAICLSILKANNVEM